MCSWGPAWGSTVGWRLGRAARSLGRLPGCSWRLGGRRSLSSGRATRAARSDAFRGFAAASGRRGARRRGPRAPAAVLLGLLKQNECLASSGDARTAASHSFAQRHIIRSSSTCGCSIGTGVHLDCDLRLSLICASDALDSTSISGRRKRRLPSLPTSSWTVSRHESFQREASPS